MPQPKIKDIKEPIAYPESESFKSPESSNIAGAIFQPTLSGVRDGKNQYETGRLTVFFQDKDKTIKSVYQYPIFLVPKWHDFKKADSKGRYFIANIKHLPSIKLAEAEWPTLS